MKAHPLAYLALGAALLAIAPGAPVFAQDAETLRLTVDVAEDFSQFVYTPVVPGDVPQRGSTFITEGNIFPGGTIEGDGASFDPNRPGALGRWYCRGIHLVGLPEILAGAPLWVHTAQLFTLPDNKRSLASDGVEGNALTLRPVTGGTGLYKGYVGQQRQQLLGFNATGGVNLRVTFVLNKAAR